MNEGVQILIERMKTHPEEFVPEYDGGVTKWGNAIGQYRTYLTAEDNKALDDAWRETVVKAMQEKFTQRVMEEIVYPKSEQAERAHNQAISKTATVLNAVGSGGYTLSTNGIGQPTWVSQPATGQASLSANTLTIGNQTLDEATLEHMKAHVEYLKKDKQKKHETLIGKLKNYLHNEEADK